MANDSIDQLSIEIESDSKKATTALNDLTKSLGDLKNSLAKLNVGKLNTVSSALKGMVQGDTMDNISHMAQGLGELSNSLKGVDGRSIKKVSTFVKQATSDVKKGSASVTSDANKMNASLSSVGNGKSNGVKHNLEETGEEATKAKGKVDSLGKSIMKAVGSNVLGNAKKIKSGIADMGASFAKGVGNTGVKAITGAFKGFGTAIMGVHRNNQSFGNSLGTSFKNILKYAFGIRSLFVLFNKLRSAIKDGFSELGKQNASVSASLNSLQASISSIGTGFAVALNPLLNLIVPIFSTIASWALTAANAVAQFFAVLTGQSTYVKASRGLGNVAAGAGKVGSGAGKAGKQVKEFKRQLMGFDEIEKLNDNDNSGSGGGGGGGGLGAVATSIDKAKSDFAEAIKNAWSVGDFTQVGRIIGTGMINALDKIPWPKITRTSRKVGKSLATLLNGVLTSQIKKNKNVVTIGNAIGYTIGKGFNVLVNGQNAFLKNLDYKALGKFLSDVMNNAIKTIDFAMMGENVRLRINGIFTTAATWAEGFDFKALGEEIKKFVNNAISGIEWKTAIKAAGDIGSGIANTINKAINPTTFALIGKTLANVINTVATGAYKLFSEMDWENTGKSIATSITTFFNEVDWKTLGLSFNKAATGILTAIKTALDNVSWSSVGKKIGDLIKSIDFGEWLSGLGDILLKAMSAACTVIKGAFETAPFETILVTAFGAMKLFGIGPLVSGLIFKKIKDAILAKAGLKAAEDVVTATDTAINGGIASKLGTGIKNGASKAATATKEILKGAKEATAAGAGFAPAAAFSAAILGVTGLAKAQDKLKGGNGKITELGGAYDSLFDGLSRNGWVVSGQKDDLFKLKEQQESTGASASKMSGSIGTALGKMGISGKQLKSVYTDLAGTTNLTSAQNKAFKKTALMAGVASATQAVKTKSSAKTMSASYDDVEGAIKDMADETGDYDRINGGLLQTFRKTYKETGSVEKAYKAVKNEIKENKWQYNDLDEYLKKRNPKAFGATSKSASTLTQKLKGVTDKLKRDLIPNLKTVKDTSPGASKGISGLKDALKDLSENSKVIVQMELDGEDVSFDQKVQVVAEVTGIDQSSLQGNRQLVIDTWAKIMGVASGAEGGDESKPVSLFARVSKFVENAKEAVSAGVKATSVDANGHVASTEVKATKLTNAPSSLSVALSTATKTVRAIMGLKTDPTLKTNVKSNTKKTDLLKQLTGNKNGNITVTVYTNTVNKVSTILDNKRTKKTNALGGIYNGGSFSPIPQFANGGFINALKGIGKFANGGIPGHGTMFVAGERGSEIVGNVGNGTTEILNQSQIASAIYSAVSSAMAKSGNGNINVYVGGKKVTDVVIENINQRTQSTGVCPILI